MAARIEIEGGAAYENDVVWRVQFHDTAYVGSPEIVKCALPIFTLDYKPETDDISAGIIPSVVQVYWYRENTNSALVNAFLDELITYQQKNYLLTIDKSTDGGTSYSAFWKGVILQDQTEEMEQDDPMQLVITATDGLGLAKSMDAIISNDTSTEPKHTIIVNYLIQSLAKLPNADLYGSGDIFLSTTMEWWSSPQTYSATANSLKTLGVDGRGFKNDENETLTLFEALQDLAVAFFCRIFMADGRWQFQQVSELYNQTVRVYDYNTLEADVSDRSANLGASVPGNRTGFRGRDNVFRYLPALKSVKITQKTLASDITKVFELPGDTVPNTKTRVVGLFDDVTNFQTLTFDIKASVSGRYTVTSADISNAQSNGYNGFIAAPYVELEVKLSDINTSNVYYLSDSGWTLTASFLTIRSFNGVSKAGAGLVIYNNSSIATIVSPGLPATGVIQVKMTYKGFAQEEGTNIYTDKTFTNLQGFLDLNLTTTEDRKSRIDIVAVTNNNADIGDTQTYDYGDQRLGDSELTTGNVYAIVGGTGEATFEWNIKNGTENLRLLQLLLEERLNAQSQPIQIYDGDIFVNEPYNKLPVIGTLLLLPMSVSFSAFTGRYTGQWYVISRNVVDNTGSINGDAPSRPILPGDGSGVVNIGDIGIGKGQIGAFKISDDEYKLVQNYRTFKSFRNKIRLLELETGVTVVAEQDDHIILLSWAGATGTGTVDLPAYSAEIDGLELVLQFDESFVSGITTELTSTGTNVNGITSGEVTANGAEKITLTLTSAGWYY